MEDIKNSLAEAKKHLSIALEQAKGQQVAVPERTPDNSTEVLTKTVDNQSYFYLSGRIDDLIQAINRIEYGAN